MGFFRPHPGSRAARPDAGHGCKVNCGIRIQISAFPFLHFLNEEG
jgi:hypothetical protein